MFVNKFSLIFQFFIIWSLFNSRIICDSQLLRLVTIRMSTFRMLDKLCFKKIFRSLDECDPRHGKVVAISGVSDIYSHQVSNLDLISKWGLDRSGGHSKHNQPFIDQDATNTMFCTLHSNLCDCFWLGQKAKAMLSFAKIFFFCHFKFCNFSSFCKLNFPCSNLNLFCSSFILFSRILSLLKATSISTLFSKQLTAFLPILSLSS